VRRADPGAKRTDAVADESGAKYGFIGLGSQGAPMARRMLAAGVPTVLWARRPESLAPYRDTPATFADSVAALGAEVVHVGICVVDDGDVRQVCDQLIPAMRPGSRIALHSTIHPQTAKAVEAQARERDIRVLDAPVSGGAPAAEAGALTVMVGGDAEDLAAARPVFETFGRLIVHLGEVGSGQVAKLVNNALLAANLGVAHNAVAGGLARGMDRAALIELVKASSGRSFALEVYERMTDLATFEHGARMLAKDVRLLGEVLGADDPAFAVLRDAAGPFLEAVLATAP
jgi:3-hydroxyisobutyrate dehydrogenase-like beta-hydroxyacid dehydrogenase